MTEKNPISSETEEYGPVRTFLAELAGKLHLNVSFELEVDERFLRINVTGPDADDLLVGKGAAVRSDVIEALQLLTSRSIGAGESNQIVVIDANRYRESRLELLERTANRIGDFVQSNQQRMTVYGMNSFDRRAIHLQLAQRGGIVTDSEGYGTLRCLVVKGETPS